MLFSSVALRVDGCNTINVSSIHFQYLNLLIVNGENHVILVYFKMYSKLIPYSAMVFMCAFCVCRQVHLSIALSV